jgi:phosphotransferase system enzyme I (PtsI)
MNPALGCRGIRFLIQNPTLLDEQLRAIVKASPFGYIKLLIPLVTDISEIIFVKSRLLMIQKELDIHKNISVGCMIEVPSSAIMSDEIAKYVDFLSIGTNDLTQYVLAADRSNSHMNYFYEGLHPSVFRLLKLIVENVGTAKPIQICGEIGANPVFTEILLALGIREFSVTPRHLPVLQERIQKIDLSHVESLLKKALSMPSMEDLHKFLIDSYMEKGKEPVSCS